MSKTELHYTDYLEWKKFNNYTEILGWLEEHMDGLFYQEADSKQIRFGFDTESDLGFFVLTWFELFKKEVDEDAAIDPFANIFSFPSLPTPKPKKPRKKKSKNNGMV